MSEARSTIAPASSRLPLVPALDGLRGVAVLIVIVFHANLFQFGWAGVQLFFVLSGFLITQILIESRERPLGAYLKRFYWRRALRIFPLYFAYLGLIAFVQFGTGFPANFPAQRPFLLTYTYNFLRLLPSWEFSPFFTHLWSLSVEEQFYLVWPVVVWWLPFGRLRMVLLALSVVSPVCRLVLPSVLPASFSEWAVGDAVYWFSLSQADAFAVGAAVALFKGFSAAARRRWLLASSFVALLTGACSVLLGRAPLSSLGFPIPGLMALDVLQHVWALSVLNSLFGALIAAVRYDALGARLLERRPLVWLGRISYGLYVVHPSIKFLVDRIFGLDPRVAMGPLAFAAFFALTFVLAHLSFELFERRFLALKDKVR